MTEIEPSIISLKYLTSDVGHIGVVSLIALQLASPRHLREDDLMMIAKVDSLSTLRNWLGKCELLQYASKLKKSVKDKFAWWHITDMGRDVLAGVLSLLSLPGASTVASITDAPADAQQIALLPSAAPDAREKIFFSAPSSSSSSDQIDQSVLDPDQIRIEEEEEAEFKKYLCRFYGFTGERATTVIVSEKILGEDICAWMYQVAQMERKGFKFRKSGAAYALACLLKNDAPPDNAIEESHYTLDQQWTLFCKSRAAKEE